MLKLNIYKKNSKEVEKTYETEETYIMYGIVEDIASIVNDNLGESEENSIISIGKIVIKAMPIIKALMLDIFEGLTQEELRRVRTDELIGLIVDISLYTAGELIGLTGDNEGN